MWGFEGGASSDNVSGFRCMHAFDGRKAGERGP